MKKRTMQASAICCLLAVFIVNAHCQSTDGSGRPSKFATQGSFEIGGNIRDVLGNAASVNIGANPDGSPYILSTTTAPLPRFIFSPFIGWFPIDGLELGFNPIEFSSNGSIGTAAIASKQFTAFFTPSYNHREFGPVFLFIEGIIGYSSMQVTKANTVNTLVATVYYSDNQPNGSGITYGVGAGFKIEVVKNGLLTFGVHYLVRRYSTQWDQVNFFNVHEGIQPVGTSNEPINEIDVFNNVSLSVGFSVAL